MKTVPYCVCAAAVVLLNAKATIAAAPRDGELLFQDEFNGQLADGWSWIREDRSHWRASARGLEVCVQPGNMWGPANNAKNVLVRPIPESADAPVEISVTLSNAPTGQWEQANLVWFYDDSNMVKLGQELVTGRFSLVMGREEGDRARSIAIVPLDANTVELRLQAITNRIRGQFRTAPWRDWRDVGECELPIKGAPKASLHFYNGPPNEEHWARVSRFAVRRLPTGPLEWPRVRAVEKSCRSAGAGGEGYAEFVVRVTGDSQPAANPGMADWMDTIRLPGNFLLVNETQPVASAPKASFDQRIYLHRDGTYGWSWDRRTSSSEQPSACGVRLDWAGLGVAAAKGLDLPLELELDVVTRLENDQGHHNLAAVLWLSTNQEVAALLTHKLTICFDWYGPASEVQTLNDGYRDYGFVPDPQHEYQYRIKGFRGAPPRVNLKAFVDDVAQRIKLPLVVRSVWFGNEIWNGSRGATLARRLDCVVGDKRYSSTPPAPTP